MRPTRTAATDADYALRASRLIARIGQRLGEVDGLEVGPSDLVSYLHQRRADLAPPSWRQYKASLLTYARHRAAIDVAWVEAAATIEAMQWVSYNSILKSNRSLRTSARKDKRPADEELSRLGQWLTLRNTQAAAFMNAALLTGLRPTEWREASLTYVGDQLVLMVKNAKSTNGRSHGAARKLWFDALNFREVQAVRATISLFADVWSREQYDAVLERIQRAFSQAAKALWPRRRRRITPYSLRHAFAAHIKQVYQPEEVAALMGHAVDETAYSHYGRRRAKTARGRSLTLPKADPEDVARVKKRYAANLAALARIKAASIANLTICRSPEVQLEISHGQSSMPAEKPIYPRYSA